RICPNHTRISQRIDFEIGGFAIAGPRQEVAIGLGDRLGCRSSLSIQKENRLPVGTIQLNDQILAHRRGERIIEAATRWDGEWNLFDKLEVCRIFDEGRRVETVEQQ